MDHMAHDVTALVDDQPVPTDPPWARTPDRSGSTVRLSEDDRRRQATGRPTCRVCGRLPTVTTSDICGARRYGRIAAHPWLLDLVSK
jgi:hypothetical protein